MDILQPFAHLPQHLESRCTSEYVASRALVLARLQAALREAKRALREAPPAATLSRLRELEGALRQATHDYRALLQQVVAIRADGGARDAAICALQRENTALRDQVHRTHNSMGGELMTAWVVC